MRRGLIGYPSSYQLVIEPGLRVFFFVSCVFCIVCVCSDSTKTVNSERLCVGGWVREQGEKRVLQIVTLPISTTTV